MATKPETKFRAKLQKRLDQIPNSYWESIQQKSIQGTPDILGCVNGWFIALEVKATRWSEPTKMQRVKLQRIVDASGMATIVHPENMDDVLSMLEYLATKEPNAEVNLEKAKRNGIRTSYRET